MKTIAAAVMLIALAANPALAGSKNGPAKAAAADEKLANRQQDYADAVSAGDSAKDLSRLQKKVDDAQAQADTAHQKCGC